MSSNRVCGLGVVAIGVLAVAMFTTQVAESAAIMTPSNASASSAFAATTAASQAVNGAGLFGDQHDAVMTNNWLSAGPGSTGTEWHVTDLRGTFNLDQLVLYY